MAEYSIAPPAMQQFKAEDKKTALDSIPAYTDKDTGDRYVLWGDIQAMFRGIGHLQLNSGHRVFFEVDNEYKM